MEQGSGGWSLQCQKPQWLSGQTALILEVHNNPELALCDGHQSLSLDEFTLLMADLKKIASAVGREI